MVIFNIYHIFTTFMKLHGCRLLYFFSLYDVKNKAIFLIFDHSSFRGVKQKKKKTRKNTKFWPSNPYYRRSDWKTWLSERFSEALTSKLWSKKNTCCQSLWKWSEIGLYSPLYGFIKNLQQIHLRDGHVKFTGKNKVSNTM